MIKQMHPEAEVTGLDEDSNILEIARKKAAKAGVEITLDHGMAFQLPYIVDFGKPQGVYGRLLSP